MPDAPTCDKCSGRQHVLTPHGWTPCECYWRSRVMRETPTVLQAGETSLPASVTSVAPWSVAEDRFEQGEWPTFRRQAWWSLAWRIGDQPNAPPLRVAAVMTTRLREISFQRDTEFASLYQLLTPDLLIVVGGQELSMHQNMLDEMTANILRMRGLYAKPTWCFGLAPAFAHLPLFYKHGCSDGAVRRELAAPQAALPAPQKQLPTAPAAPLMMIVGGKVKQVW